MEVEESNGNVDSGGGDDTVNLAEQIAAPALRGGLSPESARLFRVYRTISSMLEKRGYMIPRTLREITPSSFKEHFGDASRESLTILVEKADDENNQLFVFFPEDEKVGVSISFLIIYVSTANIGNVEFFTGF